MSKSERIKHYDKMIGLLINFCIFLTIAWGFVHSARITSIQDSLKNKDFICKTVKKIDSKNNIILSCVEVGVLEGDL